MFRSACDARRLASARRSIGGTARAPDSAGGSGASAAVAMPCDEGERPLRKRGREDAALGGVEEREPAGVRGGETAHRLAEIRVLVAREFEQGVGRAEGGLGLARELGEPRASRAGAVGRRLGRVARELAGELLLEADGAREILQLGFAACARRAARHVAARAFRRVDVAPESERENFDLGRMDSHEARHVLILLMHWLMRFQTVFAVHPESAAASAKETCRTQYERMSRRQTGVSRRNAPRTWNAFRRLLGPVRPSGSGVERQLESELPQRGIPCGRSSGCRTRSRGIPRRCGRGGA